MTLILPFEETSTEFDAVGGKQGCALYFDDRDTVLATLAKKKKCSRLSKYLFGHLSEVDMKYLLSDKTFSNMRLIRTS
jgi:hypothetical protein